VACHQPCCAPTIRFLLVEFYATRIGVQCHVVRVIARAAALRPIYFGCLVVISACRNASGCSLTVANHVSSRFAWSRPPLNEHAAEDVVLLYQAITGRRAVDGDGVGICRFLETPSADGQLLGIALIRLAIGPKRKRFGTVEGTRLWAVGSLAARLLVKMRDYAVDQGDGRTSNAYDKTRWVETFIARRKVDGSVEHANLSTPTLAI
jgi:hypothetical protein